MPSNHASTRSLVQPPTNSESFFFCNSRVMSSGRNSPFEFLDASGLPVPYGGGFSSVPYSWHPFKVSLMSSNECSMRASSGDGGAGASGVGGVDGVGAVDGLGGIGGARDDTPLPRPLRVLTILYDSTCITPKLSG
jgi:hypothetical protein